MDVDRLRRTARANLGFAVAASAVWAAYQWYTGDALETVALTTLAFFAFALLFNVALDYVRG
ncbi:MAG: hypothetical protein ABEJ04_04705 [Halobacteriaceae archaeon]